MFAATFFNGEEWREGVIDLVDGRMLLRDGPAPADAPRLDGVIVGGYTDHHVHLQLVDHTLLAGSTLGRVVDLGANPEVVAQLAVHNSGQTGTEGAETRSAGVAAAVRPELWTAPGAHQVRIEFAGAFLTPPGGYPSDRDWAPAGSFRVRPRGRAVNRIVRGWSNCVLVVRPCPGSGRVTARPSLRPSCLRGHWRTVHETHFSEGRTMRSYPSSFHLVSSCTGSNHPYRYHEG